MEDAAFKFCLANGFLLVGFTFSEAFTDAEDDLEAICEGEVNLLLEDFGSLVVVFATFAVAEDSPLLR